MSQNTKLEDGLVPVKKMDKNGIARTVYVRDSSAQQRKETPVEIASRELLAERDHYERTNCEAARVLKLGATIEQSDENMHKHIQRAENDPGLMKNAKFRDKMIAFMGYSQERAKAKRRIANQEYLNSCDETMVEQLEKREISADEHVDTKRAEQKFPDKVKANGSLVTETRIDYELAGQINAAVEKAERKQKLNATARANKSAAADDDTQRIERVITDYASEDLDDIDQLGVDEAQRKIDENLARKKKRRSLRRERDEHKLAQLTHSSGGVSVRVKPAVNGMSIYELHARLDEMVHRGDGAQDAVKSRQAQTELYSHLVNVQMQQQQRKQERTVRKMKEKMEHRAYKDSKRDEQEVLAAQRKKNEILGNANERDGNKPQQESTMDTEEEKKKKDQGAGDADKTSSS